MTSNTNRRKIEASERLLERLASAVSCVEIEHQDLMKRAKSLLSHTDDLQVISGKHLADSPKSTSIVSLQVRLDRLLGILDDD